MDIWSSSEKAMAYATNLSKATMGASEFRNASNVLMAMEIGRSYGFSPAVSLMNIHIIPTSKGPTPALTANMMCALATMAGHFIKIDSKPHRVTGTLIRGDMTPERRQYLLDLGMTLADIKEMITSVEVWDEERAINAQLLGKGNWKTYQEDMLRARVKAGLIRMACPEVLMGNLYTPDELGAVTDSEGIPIIEGGQVVMGEVVRRSPAKKAAAKPVIIDPTPEPVDAEIEEDDEEETEEEVTPGPVDPQAVVDYALELAQDETKSLEARAQELGELLKHSHESDILESQVQIGDADGPVGEVLKRISIPVLKALKQNNAATAK